MNRTIYNYKEYPKEFNVFFAIQSNDELHIHANQNSPIQDEIDNFEIDALLAEFKGWRKERALKSALDAVGRILTRINLQVIDGGKNGNHY